ncbi:zinc finger MYND domain-containing protein [Aspergillus mulundensis]|uniref:MYND-type domain-containing protein n=1 Tax=Aspergillus mulundensis TaxID=1810919 RepID=A0A3D8R499_9EURO|nr:hypothetical protein DSM5745_08548 [Aspergillus mulundensis]RDW68788.1 hypothetical protein DSM5745_08548 [Aspergillus mulundensis]
MSSTNTTQTCALCSKEATLRCSGCGDSPEYRLGDALDTFYCSRACQREHRPTHKSRCKAKGLRVKLGRAVIMLRLGMLTYREIFYDLNLTKVESRDDVLFLHHKEPKPGASFKFRPFPNHLVTNWVIQHAVLCHNQSIAAIALLGRLARKLFPDAGVPCTLETLDLHLGNFGVCTRTVPGPEHTNIIHTVIKVTLSFPPNIATEPEAWVIDPAGCQYGTPILAPYEEYIAAHKCRILNGPSAYTATETTDVDDFQSLLELSPHSEILNEMQNWDSQRWLLERRARMKFAAWVDEGSGYHVWKRALDGTSHEWLEKLRASKSVIRRFLLTR